MVIESCEWPSTSITTPGRHTLRNKQRRTRVPSVVTTGCAERRTAAPDARRSGTDFAARRLCTVGPHRDPLDMPQCVSNTNSITRAPRYRASRPGRISGSSEKRTSEAAPGTYCHSIQLPAAISQRQLEIESAEEFGVHIRVIKMDI
jgi:hypothetical protein